MEVFDINNTLKPPAGSTPKYVNASGGFLRVTYNLGTAWTDIYVNSLGREVLRTTEDISTKSHFADDVENWSGVGEDPQPTVNWRGKALKWLSDWRI